MSVPKNLRALKINFEKADGLGIILNKSAISSGQLLLPLEIFDVIDFLPHLLTQSGLSYNDNGDNLVPKELLKFRK